MMIIKKSISPILVITLMLFIQCLLISKSNAEQYVSPPSAAEIAAQDAEVLHAQQLAAIAADRAGTIDALMVQWQPAATALGYEDGWAAEFTAMLNSANDLQLLEIQSAADYDAVRAILQGQPIPVEVTSGGFDSVDALGDLSADLVFTPVTPCRVFDTRFDTNGMTPPASGATMHYYVWGNNALLSPQGHTDGTGCNAPQGEPVGIAANITVVPLGSGPNGHLRVWPYGATMPTASFVNFKGNSGALANAGILKTCYLCAYDLSVYTAISAHSLADIMGYFYAAVIPDNSIGMAEIDSNNLNSGYSSQSDTLVAGQNYILHPSFVANATGKCLVTTTAQVSTATTDTYAGAFVRTARKVGVAAAATDSQYGEYIEPIGKSRSTAQSAHAIWDVTGGVTYQFGCSVFGGGDFVGNLAYCRTAYICF